jgi:hypothetical protein
MKLLPLLLALLLPVMAHGDDEGMIKIAKTGTGTINDSKCPTS